MRRPCALFIDPTLEELKKTCGPRSFTRAAADRAESIDVGGRLPNTENAF